MCLVTGLSHRLASCGWVHSSVGLHQFLIVGSLQGVLLSVVSWTLIRKAVWCNTSLVHLVRVAMLALNAVRSAASAMLTRALASIVLKVILLNAILVHAEVFIHFAILVAIAIEHVIVVVLVVERLDWLLLPGSTHSSQRLLLLGLHELFLGFLLGKAIEVR